MIMSDLNEKFEMAKQQVMSLAQKPSNEVLLELYALNKQATLGDADGEKPGMFDFVAMAKFNAWSEKKGMAMDDAKQRYFNLVQSLL